MKYFRIAELLPKDIFESLGDKAWSLFDSNLLDALDGVREFFDKPVTVNTWHNGGAFQYRGWRPADSIVGAPKSMHKLGKAVDFTVSGMTAQEVRDAIVLAQNHKLLVNIQRMEDKTSWVHIDTGPVPEGKHRIYLFNP
jgi:hypothetical protein